MATLRNLLVELGFTDVATLLNSGNAAFTARAAKTHAARIEAAIEKHCGFSSRVVVLSKSELDDILAELPMSPHEFHPSRLAVSVFRDPAEARQRLKPLTTQQWAPERLVVGSRAAFLWCPNGLSGGQVADATNRALGDLATARNWATLTKLAALLER